MCQDHHFWAAGVLFLSILLFSIPQSACVPTVAPSTENITIVVPIGSQDHGDPKIFCSPSKRTDVAIFFFANFVTHAATVKSVPGETALSAALSFFFALLFPVSGIIRALSAIYQKAIFAKTPLETAARARALCMVVRTSRWKPQSGDVIDCLGFRITQDFERYAHRNRSGFEFLDAVQPRVIYTHLWRWFRTDEKVADLSFGRTKLMRLVRRYVDEILGKVSGTLTGTRVYHRSPALVVKTLDTEWMGQYRNPYFVPSTSVMDAKGRMVHGVCQLPQGYALSIVPPGTQIEEDGQSLGDGTQIDRKTANAVPSYEDCPDPDCPNENSGTEDVEINDRNNGDRTSRLRRIARTRKVIASWIRQRHWQRHHFPLSNSGSCKSQLSSSYSLPKGLIAIFQTLYASATLYRVRGDQIYQYGYAAFGLTVTPYLIMSILNLLSTIFTPEYPSVYMVRSDAMDEAERRRHEGVKFEGVVGRVTKPSLAHALGGRFTFRRTDEGHMLLEPDAVFSEGKTPASLPTELVTDNPAGSAIERPALMIPSCSEFISNHHETKDVLEWYGIVIASAALTSISIGVNGALTRFSSGHSTFPQQVWTMIWLACGIVFGPLTLYVGSEGLLLKLWIVCFGAPSIGGFVVVGQMLMAYGHCVQLY